MEKRELSYTLKGFSCGGLYQYLFFKATSEEELHLF